jgi:hypothetical protein
LHIDSLVRQKSTSLTYQLMPGLSLLQLGSGNSLYLV